MDLLLEKTLEAQEVVIVEEIEVDTKDPTIEVDQDLDEIVHQERDDTNDLTIEVDQDLDETGIQTQIQEDEIVQDILENLELEIDKMNLARQSLTTSEEMIDQKEETIGIKTNST